MKRWKRSLYSVRSGVAGLMLATLRAGMLPVLKSRST